MKKILVILTLILASCEERKGTVKVKPFIIVDKFTNSGACNEDDCRYTYQDANGVTKDFCEDSKKYDIGDTIK